MSSEPYSIFADEISLGDRFMGFGGVFLPSANVEPAEALLESFCKRRGFKGREMSWKKCSASKAERYEKFIRSFWALARELPPIDFRAMVLDLERYPLKAPQFKAATEEEGFYRFYYTFLTLSIAKVAPRASKYSLHIALTPDRYPYRTEILQKTVGGTVGRKSGRTYEIVEVIRDKPKAYRLHQLADVLLGAVGHRLNDRDAASHKEDLARVVEQEIGQPLDFDFLPNVRPFNVWTFTRKGDRRWAKGSRGIV